MKKLMMIAAACSALAASAAITITDVTARQRWPWNGLVDIDFTISGAAAGEAFAIDIDATAASGATQLSAKTYATEPVGGSGDNRVVWNLAADYPEFRANDLRISVTATPISDSAAIYMVIDLSGGSSATAWPVRYTLTPPAHVKGASGEPCQTTELWLRRVCAKGRTFRINSYDVNNSGVWAQQTNDFYMAIFETTQQQWYQMTGNWPSKFNNEKYRGSRPLDWFVPNDLLGANWNSPDDREPTETSVLKKMRDRTGLATISLPTEAQWQYAVAGGPMTSETTAYGPLADIARHAANNGGWTSSGSSATYDFDATVGTAYVGTYEPNSLGLYDMLGNVTEYMLDPFMSYANLGNYYKTTLGVGNSSDSPALEPQGAPHDVAKNQSGYVRTVPLVCFKGASFSTAASGVTYFTKSYTGYSDRAIGNGFRLAVTCTK